MKDAPVIPIVDFGKFSEDDIETRREVGRQMVQVCHDVGFCYIQNHGIPSEDINSAFSWVQKFWELPAEKKKIAARAKDSKSFLGWHGLGETEFATGKRDASDQFNFGSDKDTTESSLWPREDDFPGFHSWSQDFYSDCWRVVDKVLRALSLGLEQDEGFLLKVHDPEGMQMSIKHYPPVPISKLEDGSVRRLGAHTDFDSVTLLFQDQQGGLEIESQGKFVEVDPIPDAIVMNVGRIFTRWTNNYLKSTLHRVGPPKVRPQNGDTNGHNGSARETSEPMTLTRYSIPCFVKPKWDVVLEPMPGFEDKSQSQGEKLTFQTIYEEYLKTG